MPIYEYRCAACGHQEEHLQKVREPPLTVCPACGKPTFSKQLSAAGFQLKGSGWYATDFKGGGKKPAEKKADRRPRPKSREPKTESKPKRSPRPRPNPRPTSLSRTHEHPPARRVPGLFISAAVKKHFLSGALKKYFITGLLDLDPAGHHALGAEG